MISLFLVIVGIAITIYLGFSKIPNNKWANLIGSIVVGFAVCLFVYKYTYIGIGFNPNRTVPPDQIPPTSGQCK